MIISVERTKLKIIILVSALSFLRTEQRYNIDLPIAFQAFAFIELIDTYVKTLHHFLNHSPINSSSSNPPL